MVVLTTLVVPMALVVLMILMIPMTQTIPQLTTPTALMIPMTLITPVTLIIPVTPTPPPPILPPSTTAPAPTPMIFIILNVVLMEIRRTNIPNLGRGLLRSLQKLRNTMFAIIQQRLLGPLYLSRMRVGFACFHLPLM